MILRTNLSTWRRRSMSKHSSPQAGLGKYRRSPTSQKDLWTVQKLILDGKASRWIPYRTLKELKIWPNVSIYTIHSRTSQYSMIIALPSTKLRKMEPRLADRVTKWSEKGSVPNTESRGGEIMKAYFSGYDIASAALFLAVIWAYTWLIFVLGLSFGRIFY